MKINKTLIILSLLIIFCISLGAVSAADNTDIGVNDINEDSIGNTMDIKTDDANDNNINKLAEEEYKTFTELNQIISNTPEGSEIILNNSYKYDPTKDYMFKKGINLPRYTTINGKGHIIDGSNLASAFSISQASNITIKNLNFVNCSANSEGSAIYSWHSDGVSVSNCSFVGCSANNYGGAIYWFCSDNGSVSGCSFVNCSAEYGGAISFYNTIDSESVSVSGCSFVNCSANYKGGAICSNGNYRVIVSSSNFLNCSSGGDGGAIFFEKECFVSGCSFVNCSAIGDAGAIVLWDSGSVNYCIFDNNKASSFSTIKILRWGNVDYNFYGLQNNVTIDSIYDLGAVPNYWVVLNITMFKDDYIVKFVLNNGSDLEEFMPRYDASLTINNITEKIVIMHNEFRGIVEKRDYVLTSPNSGNLLANATSDPTIPNYEILTEDCEYGDPAIVTINLDNDANGNITIKVDDGQIITKTLKKGSATILIYGLNPGNHTLNISYSGYDYYLPFNTSATVTVSGSPEFDMDVVVKNITYGENVTIDVTLPANATGNVTLLVNNLNITESVVNGKVSFNVSDLGAGSYNFTLKYSGDENYTSKSHSGSFNVGMYQSTMSVSASDVSYGSDVTVNVDLDVVNGTGDIIYYLNGNEYATKDISNLTFVIKNLSAGTYYLVVEYSGDVNNTKSSAKCNFTVSKNNTYFMNISVINITVGEDEVINVTVPTDATGNVIINVNGTNYTATVKEGVAKLTIKDLKVGNYSVTASYSDNNYDLNTVTTNFTVGKDNCVLGVEDVSVVYGENATVVVIIPNDVTGTIIVTVNSKNYVAAIVGDKAIATVDVLPVNIYDIVAKLSGDLIYKDVVNDTAKLTVTKASSNIVVDSVSVVYGENATIVIKVAPSGVSGNVTVNGESYVLVDGEVSVVLPANYSAGNHTILVTYNGDNNYNSSTAYANLTVTQKKSDISVEVVPGVYNGNMTITVTDISSGATGTVTYYVDDKLITSQSVDDLAPVNVEKLSAGNHIVKVVYSGDINYTGAEFNGIYAVSKNNTYVMSISAVNITYGEDVIINVTLPDEATGYVEVVLVDVDGNEQTYIGAVKNGTVIITVSGLDSGIYTVNVNYSGDNNYTSMLDNVSFKVSKGDAFIDVNVNPVSYGDYHELTIMVPIDVTGYVNVTVNNKTYTAYVVYGEAIVDIDDSILDEGSYEAKVTLYDPNYNEFSTSIELFVFKADSDFNVEGSTVNYGENSTITVEVIVPSGDNGKVYIEGIPYDLIDGKATIDLGKYDAGEYNITVYYVPSNNNYWEAMSFAHLIVNKVMAEIAVNVSDIIYGGDAVINVSVPVDVTGTVKYYVDGVEYGTQDVGALSPLSVQDLTAGVHQVMIVYSGDNNYKETIKETSLVVNKTGLTFDVSVEDITYGGDAVINVSVPVDVTGIVKYYVDGILYETQNVDDISPVVVSYLKPGYHSVMIVYSGDDNYKETIKETGFTVNSTSILDSSIVVDNVSCTLGSPVDLVAHVVGDTGYVTFYVNDVELNSVKLVDGIAKLSYYANVSGNFVVKAVYSGSDLYNSSENTSTLVVKSPKLATSLSASTLTVTAYASKNLVVTLKDSNGKVLSGKKLTIAFNGKTYTVTTDVNGQAKLSVSSKVVKNYTATIKFAGDNSYTGSSKSVKVVIKPAYVTVADIIKAAKTLKSYSVKNKKLPSTIKVGSYKLTHAQLTYLMTAAIKHIKAGKKTSTKVKVINVKYTTYNAKISKKIMKKGYLSVVNTLYSKGVKGTLPKYFTYGGKKIGYNPYAYSLAKILAFYSSKHRLPNYCVFVNY